MDFYPEAFVKSTTEKAVAHILEHLPEEPTAFHDLYLEQIDDSIKITVDDDGRPTNSVEQLLQAFTAIIEPDPEIGTPGGMRILASVKLPEEEHTIVVNGIREVKTASRRGNPVRFNVFDSGVTKDRYTALHGELEKKNMRLIGNGIFEATTKGVFGRGMNVPFPEFYMYDKNGQKLQGRRRLPDRTASKDLEDRRGTFKTMFFLQEELEALYPRVEREVRRTYFVVQPRSSENYDTTESEEIANKMADKSKTVPITQPATAEPAAATGTP